MRNSRPPIVSYLLTALVAFQFLAGVPLCREWAAGLGSAAGTSVMEQASAAHDHSGGHGGGHGDHDHAASGHSECPEAFLAPTPHGLPAHAAGGRTPAPPGERVASPIYDVPTPVPIVLSVPPAPRGGRVPAPETLET